MSYDGNYYIFGAHSRARTLKEYLRVLHPERELLAFLADNDEPNPEQIDGVPVLRVTNEGASFQLSASVYIATRGVSHPAIEARLKTLGFETTIPVTPALDIELRNAYLRKTISATGRNFLKIDDLPRADVQSESEPSARIYAVGSVHDAPLKEPYELAPWEKTLQVGAALCKERISEGALTDDDGENISDRNRQFCEITGLYWIWKNAPQDVVGLAHYRRHFLLPMDWESRMRAAQTDVILPTPLYVAPSVGENYKMRHDKDAFDAMLDEIGTRYPDELERVKAFFDQGLYSPCNMFVMRKEALNAYCAWLFPIIFAVADRIGEKTDAYQNRYPAFLPERLLSYFYTARDDRYALAYADKNFLS